MSARSRPDRRRGAGPRWPRPAGAPAPDWVGGPVNLAPDEHDDLRWFEPAELAGLTLADPAAMPDVMRVLPGWNAPTPSPVE
ncbi:hypothetical protein B0O41_0382 [Propionibacteriaceae bacterium ES.041]|nr:hypothetical protein B0O41_0382 [Propionibacteriaceae bacterium ES.041]